MTFYRDLSEFRYFSRPEVQGALNVGWLSPLRYCAIGPTTREFRFKLFELCAKPQLHHRGYHPCLLGLCKFTPHLFGTTASLSGHDVSLGSGIIIVRGAFHTYVAPNLIYHYVTRHWYRPPKPFIDAVLTSAAVPPLRLNVSRLTSA
jgi:hypothetical protein